MAALAVLGVFCASAALAGHIHKESWYADELAREVAGRTEARMPNGTRCDVLTAGRAVEVEFAAKWCESIGQALNYAAQTGKGAGIALIIETPAEERFLARLRSVIRFHNLPIAVCVLRPFNASALELQNANALK